MKRHETVDDYIDNAELFQDELRQLRKILNSLELEETIKWGGPCYMVNGKNVVGLGAFKSYVGLWFYQGALLADPEGVLINAQEGKTKALRQLRFQSKKDIRVRLVKTYVNAAIKLQKEGKAIQPSQAKKNVQVSPELQEALSRNKRATKAFSELTLGKQREYAEYIAEAKREQTKASRIQKIIPMIAAGQGLNDKYRGGR